MTELVYAALADRLLVVDAGDRTADERLVGHALESVAASPDRPDRAFAGTVAAGIRRTTDGGEAWERVSGIGDRVTALAVSPHDPDVVWAGTEPSRVYRSADGGDTWEPRPGLTDLHSASRWSFPPRPHTHHVRWIEPDPTDPGRLYVGIEAGALVRTFDGGDAWHDHPEGARRDNHTLATHPDAPGRVYAAAGDGYAQSADGGDTWAYPQDGLGHRYVWGLAVARSDPDTAVVSAARGPRSAHTVATAEAYVYRTTGTGRAAGGSDGDGDGDGNGPEWTRATDGLPDPDGTVRSVLAAGDGPELYALNNRGLYRSDDAGASWDRVPIAWSDEYERETPPALAVA